MQIVNGLYTFLDFFPLNYPLFLKTNYPVANVFNCFLLTDSWNLSLLGSFSVYSFSALVQIYWELGHLFCKVRHENIQLHLPCIAALQYGWVKFNSVVVGPWGLQSGEPKICHMSALMSVLQPILPCSTHTDFTGPEFGCSPVAVHLYLMSI